MRRFLVNNGIVLFRCPILLGTVGENGSSASVAPDSVRFPPLIPLVETAVLARVSSTVQRVCHVEVAFRLIGSSVRHLFVSFRDHMNIRFQKTFLPNLAVGGGVPTARTLQTHSNAVHPAAVPPCHPLRHEFSRSENVF